MGGYRWRRDEDFDLFLRLAECGRVANLSDVLLHYRVHLKSEGTLHYAELVRSVREAVAEARIRRGLPPLADSDRLALEGPRLDAPIKTREHHKKWGWWALQGGHPATARKHALVAVREDPFSVESWRLAFCALRGR